MKDDQNKKSEILNKQKISKEIKLPANENPQWHTSENAKPAELKISFYEKYKQGLGNNKFTMYLRVSLYLVTVVLLIFFIKKLNNPIKPTEKTGDLKVKAEIYAEGNYYNNYHYRVKISRPSRDWEIIQVKDVYPEPQNNLSLEESIKPLAKIVLKDKEEIQAEVVLNIVNMKEPRTSQSIAEESLANLTEKYGEENIKIVQKPTPHAKGSLKATYYVAEILDAENPLTYVDLFVVKNKKAYYLHEETTPLRYEIFKWDFEHFINNLVIYK